MRRFRAFSPTSSKLFTLASPKTKMAAVTLLSAEGEYSGAQSRIATATVGHGAAAAAAVLQCCCSRKTRADLLEENGKTE